MDGVGDGARTGRVGARCDLVPFRGCCDFLRVGVDHLGTFASVEQLCPVHGDVVEFAGCPANRAHEVRDDQRRRGAHVGIGRQAATERIGDHRVQTCQVGFALDDAHHSRHDVAFTEGGTPSRAGQQGGAPGPPVGLLCGGLAAQELGCRIAGRTRDEAGACQVLIVNRHGDAEVEEDGTARRTDNVRGLDVSVNDVGVVDGSDRRREVIGQRGDAAQRDRAGGEDLRQSWTLDILGDHERLARVNLRIDDVRDEGGTYGIYGTHLALEAGPRFLRRRKRGVHDLQGDTRATPIFSKPHSARATRTEPANQAVASQFVSFIHAPSLPVSSRICVHRRRKPRPRAQKRGGPHTRVEAGESTWWPELYRNAQT